MHSLAEHQFFGGLCTDLTIPRKLLVFSWCLQGMSRNEKHAGPRIADVVTCRIVPEAEE
jgi:hypothetical protein